MNNRMLVLLSGGIDSAVVIEKYRDFDRTAIGFYYGQPHRIELEYAEKLAFSLNVPFDIVVLSTIQKSEHDIFYGRNAVLLSTAISIAQSKGIDHVAIGTNRSDWDNFPDCRPDFIELMKCVAKTYGVTLHAPLMNLTKLEVVRMARDMSFDLNKLWTCYTPMDRIPCGTCRSCIGRKNAKG